VERRAERSARRKKAGAACGAIGAVFLLLIGDPLGSIGFGLLVFGLAGALVAPILPWILCAIGEERSHIRKSAGVTGALS
jgi:hypothetical protein